MKPLPQPRTSLQPGVMAVTIGCQFPENNGNVVRLVRRHVNTPEWDFKSTPSWWCESGRAMKWRWPAGREVIATSGPIPDAKLFPIEGQKPTAQETLVGIPRSLLLRTPETNGA